MVTPSSKRNASGKMQDVSKEGRTVFFVSHNLGAVSRLCNRTLMIKTGQIVKDGLSKNVISEYLNELGTLNRKFSQRADLDIPMCLLSARVTSEDEPDKEAFARHLPITVHINYQVNKPVSSTHVYANVIGFDGSVVMGTGDADVDSTRFSFRKPGKYQCFFQIPPSLLNEGNYLINISLGVPYQHNYQENIGILSFGIVDVEHSERTIHRQRAGVIWLDIPWNYPNENPFG